MSLIEVKELTRTFGSVLAVDRISFSINKGESVGLIGANGAGKTTALRILSSLDLPDSGSVLIDGVDAISFPEKVRHRLGWMPDFLDPIANTTVWEYVDFFARAYGLKGDDRVQEVARVLDFCKLTDLQGRFINKLSKGQTQRVNMARMLIGNPDFLMMDEPAAGLDPQARVEFKQMVRQLQAEGKTLLISSHILSELAEMCDIMIFMDKGRIIRHGSQTELLHEEKGSGIEMELRLLGGNAPLPPWLQARGTWKDISPATEPRVHATFCQDDEAALRKELTALMAELPLIEFCRKERKLEDAFIDIIKTH